MVCDPFQKDKKNGHQHLTATCPHPSKREGMYPLPSPHVKTREGHVLLSFLYMDANGEHTWNMPRRMTLLISSGDGMHHFHKISCFTYEIQERKN